MPEPAPNMDRLHALAAAREIIRHNPGESQMQLVAMAWLQGRIELCQELKPTLDRPLYDNSYTCQCCGRKVGAASTSPADMAATYVCFHCSAADDTRAA